MDERPSRQRIPRLWVPSVLLLAICLVQAGLSPAASKATVGEQGLAPIRSYIAASWDTLTRSMTQCDTVVDPKLAERSILYLPADFPAPPAVAQIRKKCNVQVEHLPVVITGPGQVDPAKLGAPGLLYLENSYVVPGGRFNEMYGWDSYFIIRGLLADGRIDKARAMVENFFFEIEHYGTILNANRTYFLTRSQPPFLTSEIMGVYEAQKAAGHEDRAGLEKAYYYKGDRAMRESGFDVSSRFGPFGAATHHFAPVCLNSLLYKYETDMGQISQILGKTDDAKKWSQRAADRKAKIQKYLWDAERGLFVDYNFESQVRSSYEYITTFYPLWAGLASPEQAQALVRNLSIFEQAGGLAMSHTESGAQWDYPYAWAPTQLLAIEGLRRYGFNDDANRVSYKFLSMIAENFRRDGTIKEKYNAVTRSSETQVSAGYHMNVVGFGWTNGVFLELLHALPQDWRERLAKEQGSRQNVAAR